MKIEIRLAGLNAKVPTQAKKYDAGYDLYSIDTVNIDPGERKLINTGVVMAIPEGYYGRIAPRSGLAWKRGIDVLAGVIDASYRAPIGVLLLNTSKTDSFHVEQGDRIAQIIIEACHDVEFSVVEELNETDRGTGGFGHSGSR